MRTLIAVIGIWGDYMNTEYAILRVKRTGSTSEASSMGTAGVAGVAPAQPLDFKIEHAILTKDDVRELKDDPSVAGVAPKMPTKLIKPISVADDVTTRATPVWGLSAVGALTSAFDGRGVTVAVLDTGIDSSHPAFAGVALTEKDFSGSGNGDRVGHGTHCAGTIFGRDVGGTRIGVARGVTHALIGKVLDDQGSGTSESVLDGVQWAVRQGAKVISMSLGYDFPGMQQRLMAQGLPANAATSKTLVAYRANLRLFDQMMALLQAQVAFGQDALVVAAAGNESDRPNYRIDVSLPAAASWVLSVGALGRAGNQFEVARFSNTSPQISAPGVDIVSAKAGTSFLATMSGTSMATPHVAGIAALHWQALGGMASSRRVTNALLQTAQRTLLAPGTTASDAGDGLARCP